MARVQSDSACSSVRLVRPVAAVKGCHAVSCTRGAECSPEKARCSRVQPWRPRLGEPDTQLLEEWAV